MIVEIVILLIVIACLIYQTKKITDIDNTSSWLESHVITLERNSKVMKETIRDIYNGRKYLVVNKIEIESNASHYIVELINASGVKYFEGINQSSILALLTDSTDYEDYLLSILPFMRLEEAERISSFIEGSEIVTYNDIKVLAGGRVTII